MSSAIKSPMGIVRAMLGLIGNRSIRVRIAAGFIAVVLMTATLGVMALNSMDTLSTLTVRLYRHPFTVTNALLDIRIELGDIRYHLHDMVESGQKPALEAGKKQIADLEKEIAARMATVQERFLGDKRDVNASGLAIAEWKRSYAEMIALLEAGKRDQAKLMVDGTLRALEADALGRVDKVLDWARNRANDFMTNATAVEQSVRQFTYMFLAGVLGFAALIAFLTMQSIVRPLTALQGIMKRLADGEHNVEVSGADRRDELGAMAKTVVVFRDAAVEKVRLEQEAERQRAATEAERQAAAQAQAKAAEERAAAQAAAADAQAKSAADQARTAEERAAEQKKIADEQAHMVAMLAEALRKLADGDLTCALGEGFTGAYAQIREDFNAAVGNLRNTISAIAQNAREVANASGEITASTTDLSQRTEEQAASLEETSASMEEIAATVKKNAENAQQANASASGTREVADRGGQVVAKAVEAMARIEESSRKISDIIGVIDEIARQTNLLALNAAVEAARAGDAGRGFAVVASEVRSLAQRSSQAAKDIKDLITNSNGQVKDGVDLVNRAGTALSEIVESIKKVADVVADIANASAEQAGGIEQVNKALTQMDEVTQQNSALVEENAATAKTLEGQAGAMNERVAIFRLSETDAPPLAPAQAATKPVAKAPARPAAPAKAADKAPAAARGPVGAMHSKLATALKHDPDWEEF